MTVQHKAEPLEALQLPTPGDVLNAYSTLWGLGYRGTLSTDAGDSIRIDMTLSDAVPIAVGLGDVILYRNVSPPVVVDCVTADEFAEQYEALG